MAEDLEMTSETQQPKDIDDYEYRVKVHDADNTTVTLLFEEIDGLDGFAITIPISEIEEVLNDAMALRQKLEPHVEQRIELLKSVKQQEESKKLVKQNIESKLKSLEESKKTEIRVKKPKVIQMDKSDK